MLTTFFSPTKKWKHSSTNSHGGGSGDQQDDSCSTSCSSSNSSSRNMNKKKTYTFHEFRQMLHSESNHNHHHDTQNETTLLHHEHQHPQKQRRFIRFLFVLLPMTILYMILLNGTYGTWLVLQYINVVHDQYYLPLFFRAQRTNQQLQNEFTYYERQCTDYDISTYNVQDLILKTSTTEQQQTHTQQQLSASDNNNGKEIMLKHGAVVLPNMIPVQYVQELREYIQSKNTNITEEERYPVSQGKYRISYGIDPSESSIVSKAVQQIVHYEPFKELLISLLGDTDPALAEITAITAFYGAIPQIWHQDTKQDGNAIKYARTYSHSYSLFIPLQDITELMGPTDICPGTHMCTNDIANVCQRTKMSLHHSGNRSSYDSSSSSTISTIPVFRAGDGALLNQHLWHRGGGHSESPMYHASYDPIKNVTKWISNERIVFILSFVARPNKEEEKENHNDVDTRQLSRGTYFHQKWNMWGHTFNDLYYNPMITMRYPFSLLRCLRLYKTSNAHYGYDLITATYLRFMNNQLEEDDFDTRFLYRLNQMKFPFFLRGRILDDEDVPQHVMWRTFVKETIQKTTNFLQTITILVHVVYIVFVILSCSIQYYYYQRKQQQQRKDEHKDQSSSTNTTTKAITTTKTNGTNTIGSSSSNGVTTKTNKTKEKEEEKKSLRIVREQEYRSGGGGLIRFLYRPFRTAVIRMLITNGFCTMIYYYCITRLYQSEWGTNIRTGITLMRPFPPIQYATKYDEIMISNGYTTFPTRNDVLIGSRYDAKFLGSYDDWLLYHPGNVQLQQYMRQQQQQRLLYDPIFGSHYIRWMIHEMHYEHESRFLQQDYRTGDWRVLSDQETYEYMVEELVTTPTTTTTTSSLPSSSAPNNSVLLQKQLRRLIDYRIAEYRYSPKRKARVMATTTTYLLWHYKRNLLRIPWFTKNAEQYGVLVPSPPENSSPSNSGNLHLYNQINNHSKLTSSSTLTSTNSTNKRFQIFSYASSSQIQQQGKKWNRRSMDNSFPLRTSSNVPVPFGTIRPDDDFQIGSYVWCYFANDENWYPGTVVDIYYITNHTEEENHKTTTLVNDKDMILSYTIAFDDGSIEYDLEYPNVRKYVPITEGDDVMGCYNKIHQPFRDCYPGTVLRVTPGAYIAIHYDDNDVDFMVHPSRYYTPPYFYGGPYYA